MSGRVGLVLILMLVACAGGVERAAHCRGVPDFDLWSTDLDGNVTRLTDDAGEDGFPDWSPDGERIAYVSDRP